MTAPPLETLAAIAACPNRKSASRFTRMAPYIYAAGYARARTHVNPLSQHFSVIVHFGLIADQQNLAASCIKVDGLK